MAEENHDEALRRLLVHEGGYSNHPSDPGGPTRFGITIHDYRRYIKPDAGAADVRAMPLEAARTIYREKYWNALRCDELPAGLDYAVFDFGVNSGVSRAVKFLQRILALKEDGRMTGAVIAAARAHSASDLVQKLCDERLAFLKRLKTWPVFGRGWSRRVAEVRAVSLAMAARGHAPAPGRAATKAVTRTAAAGAVVAAGAGAAHEAARAGYAPGVIAATLAAALAAGGVCWLSITWWRRRKPETSQ